MKGHILLEVFQNKVIGKMAVSKDGVRRVMSDNGILQMFRLKVYFRLINFLRKNVLQKLVYNLKQCAQKQG